MVISCGALLLNGPSVETKSLRLLHFAFTDDGLAHFSQESLFAIVKTKNFRDYAENFVYYTMAPTYTAGKLNQQRLLFSTPFKNQQVHL
jgi:hypothetical protein